MALTELSAFETAYQVLAPLDEPGRRRALQWLSDALFNSRPLVASSSPSNGSNVAPASTKTATRRRRAAGAPSARTRKRQAASKSVATSTPGSGREYRRMPDPDEVMNAYHQVGTVSGLAEHFDVPLHTVTHWARRLRDLGYQIGRSA